MKLKHLVVVFTVIFLFTSCQTMMNMVTPKASPDMVALVMEKAAKVRFSSVKKLGKSKAGRMDIKAGQWVTTLTTNKDASGNVTLSTMKVISVSGGTVVIETESYSALDNGKCQMAQITFANYPTKGSLSYSQAEYDKTINTIKIVKMVTKDGDNPPQEMPEQMLIMAQGMSKNIVAAAVRSNEMTMEPCKTDTIETSHCYVFNYTVSVMGITRSGKSAVHSDIPINGTIRMDSEDMVQETIAFGTSGAKSMF